jgi:hypothetical protein
MAETLTARDICDEFFACGSLKQHEIDDLRASGTPTSALAPWALRADQVVFDGAISFAFERHLKTEEAARRAIVFPARDVVGDLVDLVAWDRLTGQVGLWLGRVWALGEENVNRPRLTERGALQVWASPQGYLRAGRRGVVLLKPREARWYLDGPLVVETTEHGLDLERHLSIASPKIFVAVEATS